MKLLAKIHVTLKPGVNDPQGLAISGGLQQLGFAGVEGVRAGRYLEVHLDAADRGTAERAVAEMCQQLLANPVIERYRFELATPTETAETAEPTGTAESIEGVR
ncbi:MAG: phosphoribosylformylglycinamidine synthase subunit PurS [Chloroflexota bacterium]|nr:phosphoribosylformylglycinamidine synthase subunit PurS [Chloroflexota bacterium]